MPNIYHLELPNVVMHSQLYWLFETACNMIRVGSDFWVRNFFSRLHCISKKVLYVYKYKSQPIISINHLVQPGHQARCYWQTLWLRSSIGIYHFHSMSIRKQMTTPAKMFANSSGPRLQVVIKLRNSSFTKVVFLLHILSHYKGCVVKTTCNNICNSVIYKKRSTFHYVVSR